MRGEPVAAVYNLIWSNKVYFYQSGRKTDVPPKVRPGVVLLAHAIRGAIEAGRREFDFLAGDSQYKRQMALASRPLVQIRVARRCFRERLRSRRGTRHRPYPTASQRLSQSPFSLSH